MRVAPQTLCRGTGAERSGGDEQALVWGMPRAMPCSRATVPQSCRTVAAALASRMTMRMHRAASLRSAVLVASAEQCLLSWRAQSSQEQLLGAMSDCGGSSRVPCAAPRGTGGAGAARRHASIPQHPPYGGRRRGSRRAL
jgi:hypothetical protein